MYVHTVGVTLWIWLDVGGGPHHNTGPGPSMSTPTCANEPPESCGEIIHTLLQTVIMYSNSAAQQHRNNMIHTCILLYLVIIIIGLVSFGLLYTVCPVDELVEQMKHQVSRWS